MAGARGRERDARIPRLSLEIPMTDRTRRIDNLSGRYQGLRADDSRRADLDQEQIDPSLTFRAPAARACAARAR